MCGKQTSYDAALGGERFVYAGNPVCSSPPVCEQDAMDSSPTRFQFGILIASCAAGSHKDCNTVRSTF